MSVEAIAIVLNHSRAAKDDVLVLVGIANHDGDGGAWPSLATLAKYARKSEDAVRRSLRRLEELGEVTTEQRAGGTAQTRDDRRPNRYTILVRCPPGCDGTTQHRVDDPASTRGREGSDDPASTPERPRVDADDDPAPTRGEPSVQPSKKPSSRRRRASSRADELTREWWERNVEENDWRPDTANAFVASRSVIDGRLHEGYTDDEVREALRRIGPRILTAKRLSDTCYGVRRDHEGSRPKRPWFDEREGRAHEAPAS